MATISGRIYYSPSSYYDAINGPKLLDNNKVCIFPRYELKGIPIVLVNDSGEGRCVLSDSSGYFKFEQIPVGIYKVIEAFGRNDGVTSPYVYTSDPFISLGTITPKDPTTLYIDSLGLSLKNGDAIISLTPNTFEANLTNEEPAFECTFIDAPVINYPLFLSNYKRVGNNLITSADNGTFGSNIPGTAAGTSPNSAPSEYSNITEFKYDKYSLISPDGGYYSLCNILNLQTFEEKWLNCADHTKGDETGRTMIVNNDDPDKYFFQETISNLDPSATYLFSGWFLNIYRFSGYHPPAFKLSIISSLNRVIAEKSIDDSLLTTSLPTWKEVGIIVNLKNLSTSEIVDNKASVTVKLISLYKETLGNDFLVDDLSFTKVIQAVPTLTKKSNTTRCYVGSKIEYTSVFTNNSDSDISKLMFIDSLPNGTTLSPFNSTSSENLTISINGFVKNTTVTTTQLSQGIDISEILKNSSIPNTIPDYYKLQQGIIPIDASVAFIFLVVIFDFDLLETKPVIINTSSCNYVTLTNSYSETITSNICKITVSYPEISVLKQMSKIVNDVEVNLDNNSSLFAGENFIYKITITNTGTRSVNDMIVADNIDSSIIPIYSTNSDCTGITKEIISYMAQEKTNVICSEITKINNNINNIEISNITVPAAFVVYSSEERTVTPGITIIRISCKVKS